MKKVLLAGTALVATALIASPAQAELKLDLGGHFSGYGVYVDEDEAAGTDYDNFVIRKNTEIHFTGETTLDNGLTVGVHVEQDIENQNDNDESYAYFSGGWGRVNFGNEDGAAYLLQVAAPAADSNVDGLRTTIQGYSFDFGTLDYDHAQFGNTPSANINGTVAAAAAVTSPDTSVDRFTYLTPKFNGFQAAASYAPRAELAVGVLNTVSPSSYEDLWEVSARWDGEFEGVGLSFGAGYSTSDATVGLASGAGDAEAWNVGFNLGWNQFSFGGSWLDEENNPVTAFVVGGDVDTTTWVLGAAWDNGPYHVGVSYLDRTDEIAATPDIDSYKTTIGGGYQFGPGMTFRGAVAFGEASNATLLGAGEEGEFTQVTLGTDIQF
ncbi:porin [Salipiger marinus]|uniref:Outer membrane protein (Porin) n=1 Tax=Salipiger marinus TaxID=555512 RepID=A0A1G8U7G4_9RHOB|nr:porin [Salipiger marinus]SDJ49671.1 Outer membrane protein (porin) [Salipiger marinus]